MKRVLAVVTAVLLITAFIVICIVGASLWYQRIRKAAIAVNIKADIANYTAALMTFSNTFGVLPTGSNAVTTTGNNARKLVFLSIPGRVNAIGEFTDPTGKPYKIDVATNSFQISAQ